MNNTLTLFNKNTSVFLLKCLALSAFLLMLNFFNYFFHFVLPYSIALNFLFTFIFAGLINFLPIEFSSKVKSISMLTYFFVIYVLLYSSNTGNFEAFKLLHIWLGLFFIGKDKSIYQNLGVLAAVLILDFYFIANHAVSW